jgi:hypothetical protein
MNNQDAIRLRRTRSARVVEHRQGVTAYPEPYRTPVLPDSWGPLDAADEVSVLLACDELPDDCRLRLRSLWDPECEFRVYCLKSDAWRGICAATMFTRDGALRNTRLLAVALTPDAAARVALDFLNWDLEADGSPWRLDLLTAAGATDR